MRNQITSRLTDKWIKCVSHTRLNDFRFIFYTLNKKSKMCIEMLNTFRIDVWHVFLLNWWFHSENMLWQLIEIKSLEIVSIHCGFFVTLSQTDIFAFFMCKQKRLWTSSWHVQWDSLEWFIYFSKSHCYQYISPINKKLFSGWDRVDGLSVYFITSKNLNCKFVNKIVYVKIEKLSSGKLQVREQTLIFN